MSRKPSKNWLQSLLSRQNSARDEVLDSNVDDAINDSHYDAIADGVSDASEMSRATPRSMTLAAERMSKLEEYRMEEQQRH